MSQNKIPTLLSILILTLAIPALAQVKWTQLSPATSSSARSNCSMVWSLHENRAILFGGEGGGNQGDTWSWNGFTWTQLSPLTPSPSKRSAYGLSYSLLDKKTLLFSGWNGNVYLPDTWEWDGIAWKNVSPATQPAKRDWMGMAYDFRSLKTILFAGHDWTRQASSGPYGDTWAWDDATKTWTRLSPTKKPPARFGHVMAHDPLSGKIIMLCGSNATPDMWEWTGTDWNELKPTNLPTKRTFATMVFDSYRNRMVLYGGKNSGVALDDVWEWDGSNWTQRSITTAKPGVAFAAGVYDPTRKEFILFGGALAGSRKTPSGKTWSYATTKPAGYVPFGVGCKGAVGTPVLSGTDPWTGDNFTITVTGLTAGNPAFIFISLSKTNWGPISLPFDLSPIGAAGCKLYVSPLLQFPLSNASGTVNWTVPLPKDPALAGFSFFNQVYAADSTANSAGLVVSNAGEGKVGMR